LSSKIQGLQNNDSSLVGNQLDFAKVSAFSIKICQARRFVDLVEKFGVAVGVRPENACHLHGRPQKFFQVWQRRHIAYPFQVADGAMQMNDHKALYPFYTTKKITHDTATVTKYALRWQ